MAENNENEQLLVRIIAIVAITFLEAIAMLKGIDGKLFATVTAMIGYIAGVKIPLSEIIKNLKVIYNPAEVDVYASRSRKRHKSRKGNA